MNEKKGFMKKGWLIMSLVFWGMGFALLLFSPGNEVDVKANSTMCAEGCPSGYVCCGDGCVATQ